MEIGGLFTIFLIIALVIICGLATYYDAIYESQTERIKTKFILTENTKNITFSSSQNTKSSSLSNSLEILRCFSITSNLSKLVEIRTTKKGDNSNVLNSLRVLSISWIISSHVFGFYSLRIVTNMIELPEIAGKLWVAFIYGGFFAVDFFFFFSGFLLGYLLLNDIEKKRGELGVMDWTIRNVHRFFRLLPLYAFLMLFFNTVWPSMGSGPIWSYIKEYNIKQCEDYWWTNLLFLIILYLMETEIHVLQLGDTWQMICNSF
ncbi:unnamed protein product [Blepharisma stoltei]|uniref:Acyltransferase 3 domain-containing protein n=1 Tax=Blepharisma stoltei TaxID=1481888 RepID=A0AAU9JY56_9CILI|nr:unnamed protein product [Blepharisma stoltei]